MTVWYKASKQKRAINMNTVQGLAVEGSCLRFYLDPTTYMSWGYNTPEEAEEAMNELLDELKARRING